jgi:hypothetical protein
MGVTHVPPAESSTIDTSTVDIDIERHFVIFDMRGFSLMHNDMRCLQQLININQVTICAVSAAPLE